jgi:hypothetical protein
VECFTLLPRLLTLHFIPPSRKWFLEALGHEGLNNLLAAYEDKTAEAVCTFAYCKGSGEEVLLFQGRTEVCPPYPFWEGRFGI